MRIESLVYRPVFGGLRNGLFTLELRLGGSDSPQFSNVELIGRILQASAEFDPRVRVLFIKDFQNINENWETIELISSLKDSFEIVADITGYQRPGWVSLASSVRVTIMDTPWLMFKADEIYYRPAVDGIFVEPLVPPADIGSMRYLVLNGKGSTEKGESVISFLRKSRIPWMVIYPPKTTYEVKIL